MNLPTEILNIIFSFVERHHTNKLLNYLIEECYENYDEQNPYVFQWKKYCCYLSFSEWYFLHRKWCKHIHLQ